MSKIKANERAIKALKGPKTGMAKAALSAHAAPDIGKARTRIDRHPLMPVNWKQYEAAGLWDELVTPTAAPAPAPGRCCGCSRG